MPRADYALIRRKSSRRYLRCKPITQLILRSS